MKPLARWVEFVLSAIIVVVVLAGCCCKLTPGAYTFAAEFEEDPLAYRNSTRATVAASEPLSIALRLTNLSEASFCLCRDQQTCGVYIIAHVEPVPGRPFHLSASNVAVDLGLRAGRKIRSLSGADDENLFDAQNGVARRLAVDARKLMRIDESAILGTYELEANQFLVHLIMPIDWDAVPRSSRVQEGSAAISIQVMFRSDDGATTALSPVISSRTEYILVNGRRAKFFVLDAPIAPTTMQVSTPTSIPPQ